MTMIDPKDEYPKPREYMKFIGRVLEGVFGLKPQHAEEMIRQLQSDLARRMPEQ